MRGGKKSIIIPDKIRVYNALGKVSMMENTRDEILSRLRTARSVEVPQRIELPPPYEAALTREERIEKFAVKLGEQTGLFYRTPDNAGILEILGEIVSQENLKNVMASEDALISSLDLNSWGREHGVAVSLPHDFKDRETFKDAIFNHADAGITVADFAVAESGTLAIVHDKTNARLLSLAPILHIAVVKAENVVPVYESVIEAAFSNGQGPSQICFITGPSMTGDIQGQMFKGMHGPRKLIVIMVG
jgi:L-lactate dehydrogenase complex protein LldG